MKFSVLKIIQYLRSFISIAHKVSQLSILEQRGNETDFLSIEEYVEIMTDLGKGREASKVKQ